MRVPLSAGQRALAIAVPLGDISLQVTAHFYLGRLYHALGDYHRAIALLRQNVALLTRDLLHVYFGLAALPSVQSRTWLAWCLAELGAFAEGMACGAEGVHVGEVAKRPHDLTFCVSRYRLCAPTQGRPRPGLSLATSAAYHSVRMPPYPSISPASPPLWATLMPCLDRLTRPFRYWSRRYNGRSLCAP